MERWSPEFRDRFRCGDRAVVEEVYWAHVGVVEHVLRSGFRLKSRQVAVPGLTDSDQRADLLQEVFVKAFSDSARQNFDPALDFRAYILSISRHLLIDHYRRVTRCPISHDPELDEAYANPPSADDHCWQSSELLQVVEQYVATLRPPLSELHHARYVLGKSQREVADGLGLSRQNVRTLEERVKEGLRSALHEALHAERSVRNAFEATGRPHAGRAGAVTER